jgi:hypothetical protein
MKIDINKNNLTITKEMSEFKVVKTETGAIVEISENNKKNNF